MGKIKSWTKLVSAKLKRLPPHTQNMNMGKKNNYKKSSWATIDANGKHYLIKPNTKVLCI